MSCTNDVSPSSELDRLAPNVRDIYHRSVRFLDTIFSPDIKLNREERLSQAKQINLNLLHLEIKAGIGRVSSRPSAVELPVAGKCNLRCEMCGLSHGDPLWPNWTLDQVSQFDPILRYAQLVNPTGAGEPLLVKEFINMLSYFSELRLSTSFFSNGTLLDDQMIDRLLKCKISTINFSIDGATKETYEKVRKHARFETVLGNVRRFIDRKNQLKLSQPLVRIAVVLLRDNIHEFPDLIRLGKEIGVNGIYSAKVVTYVVPELLLENDPVRANSYLREGRRVAAELGISLWAPDDLPEAPVGAAAPSGETSKTKPCFCSHPWGQMVVINDGHVTPCCYYNDKIDDGLEFWNIKEHSPTDCWNSPALVSLRRRMWAGCPPATCANCPVMNSKFT